MRGQAVALRVWGGGWLKYGNETWGVDLVLSDTPSYEWYVVGGTPGIPIDNGPWALCNNAAHDYLVYGDQTWGVNLNWYQKTLPPPPAPAAAPAARREDVRRVQLHQRAAARSRCGSPT